MPDYHPDGRPEQIHLPAPSLLPFAAALGLLIGLMGLILSWWFVGIGAAVLLFTVVRWVQTARLEIGSLPAERE